MNQFLIPANSKKSMLIFGLFNQFDLIMFVSGLCITLLLLLILEIETSLTLTIIALLPAAITSFLVMPVPSYYNVRTLLVSCHRYYTNKRKFIWKGWCFLDEQEK